MGNILNLTSPSDQDVQEQDPDTHDNLRDDSREEATEKSPELTGPLPVDDTRSGAPVEEEADSGNQARGTVDKQPSARALSSEAEPGSDQFDDQEGVLHEETEPGALPGALAAASPEEGLSMEDTEKQEKRSNTKVAPKKSPSSNRKPLGREDKKLASGTGTESCPKCHQRGQCSCGEKTANANASGNVREAAQRQKGVPTHGTSPKPGKRYNTVLPTVSPSKAHKSNKNVPPTNVISSKAGKRKNTVPPSNVAPSKAGKGNPAETSPAMKRPKPGNREKAVPRTAVAPPKAGKRNVKGKQPVMVKRS